MLQNIKQKKYCDGIEDTVVLYKEGASRFQMDFTIIKDGFVEKVEKLHEADEALMDYIPIVDDERTKLREGKAVKNAKLEAAKIGEGVTDEAQYIFNALSKTLPCRWKGKHIIVLEEVEITEPYGLNDCNSLHSSDSTVVTRVKKVLEEEKKKLG